MKIGKRTGKRWRRGGTSGKRPERGSKSWSFLLHNRVKVVLISHQEPLCKTFRYSVMYITRVREV